MRIFFRHEKVRAVQKEMMKDIYSAFVESKHIIIHAPTGCGKTDASLSPAISYAIENNLNVFFMTPKISQHLIAMSVVKDLRQKFDLDIRAVDLVGKSHLCINEEVMDKEVNDFYELCKKKVKNHECPHYIIARGYNVKQRSEAKARLDEILRWYGAGRSCTAVKRHCLSYGESYGIKGPCPYEVSLEIAKRADVLICDYYHVLNPYIASSFLDRIEKELEDSILIIDEAHNSPERLRAALSSSLDKRVVLKAAEEARSIKNKVLAKHIEAVIPFIEKLEDRMDYEEGDEAIVYKEELPSMRDFLLDMEESGLEFLEKSNRHRSYLLRMKRFFSMWEEEDISFLRLMRKTERGLKIDFKCLDPSVISSEPLNRAHSTVLMSATLKPGSMYRDMLGLDADRTVIKEYKSPFPKKNRLVLIDKSISTKYERRTESEYKRMAEHIRDIVNNVPGNSAVFFPSYKVMGEVLRYIGNKIKKRMFTQQEGMKAESVKEMLESFQAEKERGAVIFAVSGGSLAEGIDLPGKSLLAVVVVGIPLGEPDIETKALIRYYDFKYGKGWDYGYIFPAMNKAVQAAGRCIRSETDKGLIVFMDERFAWSKYKRLIPEEYEMKETSNFKKTVRKFWSSKS
ncbi:hypothetical protein DRN74_05035 [Candidatus Micrarchaeota archaeon]|nr:MAG: hypothetical protein DRN74_05035 [Candidatus Micrarchaeota archaeon]